MPTRRSRAGRPRRALTEVDRRLIVRTLLAMPDQVAGNFNLERLIARSAARRATEEERARFRELAKLFEKSAREDDDVLRAIAEGRNLDRKD